MQKNNMNIHRGQLQIAETLVSVALMLVLAILLISATNKTLSPSNNFTELDQTATDILTSADEAGLLRPLVYTHSDNRYQTEFESYQSLMDEYISSMLSNNIDYALIAHEIKNGIANSTYINLIGSPSSISALQQGGEGAIANYHLGSFASADFGQYFSQYLVQLYLWEKF